MFFLMQELLCRVVGLSRRTLLAPIGPPMLCSLVVGGAVWGAGALCQALQWGLHPLAILAVQILAGAAFYLLFLFRSGLREVEAVVNETLEELAPRVAAALRA
jgi:hypothetical protein